MLKLSWPLIPHALGFVLLSSSSRIIMNLYQVSLEDIGLFSNGYMMGDYITIITTSLVVALVPQLQKLIGIKGLVIIGVSIILSIYNLDCRFYSSYLDAGYLSSRYS